MAKKKIVDENDTPVPEEEVVQEEPKADAPMDSYNPFVPMSSPPPTYEAISDVFKQGTQVYVRNGIDEVQGKNGIVDSVVERVDKETRQIVGVEIMVRFRMLAGEMNAIRPLSPYDLLIVGKAPEDHR